MTWFEELTPYSYLRANVGWLDAAHAYPRGATPASFVARVHELVECAPTQATRDRDGGLCSACSAAFECGTSYV